MKSNAKFSSKCRDGTELKVTLLCDQFYARNGEYNPVVAYQVRNGHLR